MDAGVGVAAAAFRGGGVLVWLAAGGAELQLARSKAAAMTANAIGRRTSDRDQTQLTTLDVAARGGKELRRTTTTYYSGSPCCGAV